MPLISILREKGGVGVKNREREREMLNTHIKQIIYVHVYMYLQ